MKKIKEFTKNMALWLVPMVCAILASCQEDVGIQAARIGEKSNPPSNLTFEEAPGGAIVYYDLPPTPDLRYIKALYTHENGRTMVGKSSIYDNRITIEGFAEIGDYDIQLVAVSVGEVESDPVTIRIRTGKPIYQIIAESFLSDERFFSTFGGVNVIYENPESANLILQTFRFGLNAESGQEEWISLQDVYTQALNGTIRVRGEEAIENLYAVVVRDQWGNVSDTIQRLLTPIAEYEFENILVYNGIETYSDQNRNGDFTRHSTTLNNSAAIQTSLFDGSQGTTSYNRGTQWWGQGAPVPMQFTLDIQRNVQMSRITVFARTDNRDQFFQTTHVKTFELYGSNDPASDGSWESWTLIGQYEGTRPSGLPYGTLANAEDIEYAERGEDYEINWPVTGGFRYIRLRVTSTWNGLTENPLNNAASVIIAELRLFGIYVD